jgi:hypothetical protein
MVPNVQQDVSQRGFHLPRRPQQLQMVPPVQDRPDSSEGTVHGARQPSSNRLHAACESDLPFRLHDEMHMVSLQEY